MRVTHGCYVWQNLDCLDHLLEKELSFMGYSLMFYSLINLGAKLGGLHGVRVTLSSQLQA